MKIKILSLVLTAILIISILSAIAVYATVGSAGSKETDSDVKLERTVSRNVDKTKTVKLGNGETVELDYNITRNISLSQYTDVYKDRNDNVFEFNSSGELSGYVVNSAVQNKARDDESQISAGQGTAVTESEAVNVAKKHLSEMYGDRFADFELFEVQDHSGYIKYMVIFAKKYGEDGFIAGNLCYCDVFSNGSVYSSDMVDIVKFDDFNEDCLKDITEEKLYEYAKDSFGKVYGERMRSIEVSGVNLVKNGSKYGLNIIVGLEIEFENHKTTEGAIKPCYALGEVLYYELD